MSNFNINFNKFIRSLQLSLWSSTVKPYKKCVSYDNKTCLLPVLDKIDYIMSCRTGSRYLPRALTAWCRNSGCWSYRSRHRSCRSTFWWCRPAHWCNWSTLWSIWSWRWDWSRPWWWSLCWSAVSLKVYPLIHVSIKIFNVMIRYTKSVFHYI